MYVFVKNNEKLYYLSLYCIHSLIPWDQQDICLHTVTSSVENWLTYFMTGMNSSFCFTHRFRDRFTIAAPHCKFHWGISADVTLQAYNAPLYHINMLMIPHQTSVAAFIVWSPHSVGCLFACFKRWSCCCCCELFFAKTFGLYLNTFDKIPFMRFFSFYL